MASLLSEDGVAPASGLGFDVLVFKKYLESLLPPGMSGERESGQALTCNSHDCDSTAA